MPQLFLSHNRADKPFVEKLAKDLMRLGIQVWYDRYEIKVGDSLFWKIDEGLSDTDYFGMVLSPEALASEWVRAELGAAWSRQMGEARNVILPIYLRSCTLPTLIRDIKYADFRDDYDDGLRELAATFGIREIGVITADNWRRFARVKGSDWHSFQEDEFKNLVTDLCRLNEAYQFDIVTGGAKNPYSVMVHKHVRRGAEFNLTIRMSPRDHYRYMAAESEGFNPNHVPKASFTEYAGSTANEAVEFLCARMRDFHEEHGPFEKPGIISTYRFYGERKRLDMAAEMARQFTNLHSWDQRDSALEW